MKYVLFVCTQNAGRSQMAQSFFERHAPADMRAESAGQQPRREGVWPNVVDAMREVGIEERVLELIDGRLDLIRSDRTAHQLRLQKLLPRLAEEFAGRRSDGEIRACADAILGEFADVPVRSHVLTLAYRRTRACLRAEYCAAVSA